MSSNWTTKNGRTSKRGLFAGGIWHCDCEPPLPAENFQVKNGGKNHGRWFYTCQKSQVKRCPFFLWSDDAKIREEAAVLNNSKSEPGAQRTNPSEPVTGEQGNWNPEESVLQPKTPRTPMRQSKITEPITPVSNMKRLQRTPSPPQTNRSKTLSPRPAKDNDEAFDWSSSADDEFAELADAVEINENLDSDRDSPRKSARVSFDDSPSKRKPNATTNAVNPGPANTLASSGTWLLISDDVSKTPFTCKRQTSDLLSPGTTPAHHRHLHQQPDSNVSRNQHDTTPEEHSPLALSALSILSPIRPPIPTETEQSLINLLNRHDLRTQGILKGREIARTALQSKEKKIAELQQRIASLEAERDTSRMVIQHLKTDIATSPKRERGRRSRDYGGGSGGGSGSFRRSEV